MAIKLLRCPRCRTAHLIVMRRDVDDDAVRERIGAG
jgi:hypothetical protein